MGIAVFAIEMAGVSIVLVVAALRWRLVAYCTKPKWYRVNSRQACRAWLLTL
jgi:hypothetical protein